MKKTCFTLLFFVLLASETMAQFAFESGVNMANMAIKAGGNTMGTTFLTGAAVGMCIGIECSPNIYFEPGLFYEMNGCKITADPKGEYIINTIGVPLNIEYKSGEKCGARFFAGGGLHIGYNVSGSYTFESYGPLPGSSGELKFGGPKGSFKTIDLGAGVNVGYQFKGRLYVRAHYCMGLSNLNSGSDKDNSVRTSAIGLTIGYSLARCGGGKDGNVFRIRRGNHWRGMSKGKYSHRLKHPY